MTKMVNIGDFLTDAQVQECIKLKTANMICVRVILPNIKEINEKLGQENNAMYLAYAVEYALTQARPK